MSCGCNEIDADNPNSNTSCGPCNPCTSESASCESLPSALDNFTTHFFGTVSKTLVNGKVQWSLPCNLDGGLPDNPRNAGEGLACYFLRLFGEGIIGLTGARGPKGDAGKDGIDGVTYTATDLVIPEASCPVCQVTVQDASVIPIGAYIFVSGGGWFSIVSRGGNTLQLQLIEAIIAAGTTVSAGALVALTGPEGPQGLRGPRGYTGDKGDKGNLGTPGAAGTDGESARTTTSAPFVQPAVGSSVVVSVYDSSYFTGGQQVYIIGGGYYTVIAVVPGSITVRNLGIAATNSVALTNINTGASVFVSAVSPTVAESEVTGSGSSDFTADATPTQITFDGVELEITLPSPGTYIIYSSLDVQSGAPAPKYVAAQLYDQTAGTLISHPEYESFGSITTSRASITMRHRVTVAAATTYRVHAWTDTNTADFLSGGCLLDWMLVNPVNP